MCGERRRKLEGKKGERNIDGKASSTQKVLHELKRSQLWLCLQASALPENMKRKQKLLPFFNVGISHFCTQTILTLLPDDASLSWPLGVQRLGSPDLCICLFLLHNLRRCLNNWCLRCCKGNIGMSSFQRV